MKRQTREEIAETLRFVSLDRDASRMYASALRNNEQPAIRVEVYEPTDDEREYTEVWSLFKPTAASGGIVLVEQFVKGSREVLAWNVSLLCETRVSDVDYSRRDALSKLQSAHAKALGL